MLCILSSFCHAQEQDSMRSVSLDSVVVSARRNTSGMAQRTDGMMVWQMKSLMDMPKILGNADPMHFAQMLPGVQTNTEFRCGTNIEGCDNSHNVVELGGVPVYNASHLLGMFSVFNASHYSTMNVAKTPVGASSAARIGGTLSFEPFYEAPSSTTGEASVGLVSSQVTVRSRLGRNTHATLSLRASYINLLYGHWLRADDNDINYFFYDANLTLVHRFSASDALAFDAYAGTDNAKITDPGYFATMRARWGNIMGALHWLHDAGLWHMRHTIYATSYANMFRLEMEEMKAKLPSSIADVGWRSDLRWLKWEAGGAFALHRIKPQGVESYGDYELNSTPMLRTTSLEASLYADYTQPLGDFFSVDAGVRASLFSCGGSQFAAADPTLYVYYDNNRGVRLRAGYFLRHQYLFLTGFSDAGLPSEFWMPADADNHPQFAHGGMLGATVRLAENRWQLSADLFFRRLYNQTEYSGNIIDIVATEYDLNSTLLRGSGRNYGASVMVQKSSGKLTGWMSYTYTKARRTFNADRMRGSYPASHERPHELNMVATYAPWRHFDFCATLVWASGTPFTAPVSVNIINGNIMAKYGRHNANRYADYMRLDLSANYKWTSPGGTEHGFNLSVCNATAHKNELFYRLRISTKNEYAYRPMYFVLPVLPSVSYYCRF